MAFFPSNLRMAGAALGAMVAVAPLCSGACGSTACFVYSQAQYAASNGCPPRASAINDFGSPSCGGNVTMVDSEGSFDGAYCCYSVTQANDNGLLGPPCIGGGGGSGGFGGGGFGGGDGGAGGIACAAEGDPCDPGISTCCAGLDCDANNQCVSGIGGQGGSGAFGGAGGTGASPPCITCSDEFNAVGATASELCASSAPLWNTLATCACGGTCNASCAQSFCAGIAADGGCLTCLGSMTNGCGQAFGACEGD
jgi:hypothetical protein